MKTANNSTTDIWVLVNGFDANGIIHLAREGRPEPSQPVDLDAISKCHVRMALAEFSDCRKAPVNELNC